jgi:hypothetical protein
LGRPLPLLRRQAYCPILPCTPSQRNSWTTRLHAGKASNSAFVVIYTILAPRAAGRAKVFGNQLEELMKANHRITVAALAGIVLGALTIIVSGNAAMAQDTVRVRGAIESIDGPTYVIKTRDGDQLKVALPDKAQIAVVVKASLADIKQGLFVGVTAMPQADGSQSAIEVHIFPEAIRGTGEGHYSWDLRARPGTY